MPPHRRPDAADGEQQGFWRAGSGGPGFAGYAPEGKLFKTKLCANFSESGQCRYGDRCNFAHGEQELQPMPQFYRGGGGWGGEEGEAGGEVGGPPGLQLVGMTGWRTATACCRALAAACPVAQRGCWAGCCLGQLGCCWGACAAWVGGWGIAPF